MFYIIIFFIIFNMFLKLKLKLFNVKKLKLKKYFQVIIFGDVLDYYTRKGIFVVSYALYIVNHCSL